LTEVDGPGHLQTVAVHPAAMRRGWATWLVDASPTWARAQGYNSLTLTTFLHVAFNAPFYTLLGFVPFTPTGPEL
jgi:GNAT superfamily N-acetyltransferase